MKTLLLSILLSLPFLSYSQYSNDIYSDRPGQAIKAPTLGEKVFQLQMGYSFQKIRATRILTNSTVLRIGITDRIELNGLVDWKVEETRFPNDGFEYNAGISNTEFGVKINVLRNDKWIPAVSFQTRLLLPGESLPFQRQGLGADLLLITVNDINENISFHSNWGLKFLDRQTAPTFNYVFNLSYRYSRSIGAFSEVYGNSEDPIPNFGAGLSILANKDLKFDISGAWQGNGVNANWLLGFGISWRFDWRE
ncbi:MAG: transporter [Bacteroidota bacterium]